MFCRQVLIKTRSSLKQPIFCTKVENVAFYHVNCPHHSELNNSANKFLKSSRRSAFSSELLVRYKSSSSAISNASTEGLDPIPEPPVPCSEIAQSAVEIQRFFTEFHRSGSTPQPITESQLVDSVVTFSDLPHIYRRTTECCHSLCKQPIGTLENTYLTANEPSETGYHSIFDTIPDPPAISSAIETSLVESVAVLGEPTFASQGLGGWSPSGWVQYGLECLHIDCGLPWWGAIVCGTLVLRLLMFPIVVISQRNAAKLNNSMPQVQYIQMKVTEARQRGDKLDAARYTAELMALMKEKDVNPIKNMLPSLCQQINDIIVELLSKRHSKWNTIVTTTTGLNESWIHKCKSGIGESGQFNNVFLVGIRGLHGGGVPTKRKSLNSIIDLHRVSGKKNRTVANVQLFEELVGTGTADNRFRE